MSDWEIGIIGFLAGASVVDLIWSLVNAAQKSTKTSHVSCRACGKSFMAKHDCVGGS